MENLYYSFPEKTQKERNTIARAFYSHLADLMVEVVKMFTMDEKTIRKHFISPTEIKTWDQETLDTLGLIQESKAIIGMLGHYGNWEWASFCSCLNFIGKENWVVYKPLSNKKFDILLNKVRSRFGAELIDMRNVPRKFAAGTKSPYLSYFVSDQSPVFSNSGHKITFLNQETLVYLGAEKIAHSRNIPVIYIEIQKLRRGVYTSKVELISKNPAEWTPEDINLAFQRKLEKTIQERPEYWLWSHKRWKYTRK